MFACMNVFLSLTIVTFILRICSFDHLDKGRENAVDFS